MSAMPCTVCSEFARIPAFQEICSHTVFLSIASLNRAAQATVGQLTTLAQKKQNLKFKKIIINYGSPTTTGTAQGGAVSFTCSPVSGSSFAVGTTTVTCTATQAEGQSATCLFGVTVGARLKCLCLGGPTRLPCSN